MADTESSQGLEAIRLRQEEHEKKIQKLQDSDARHDDDIKQLYVAQEGTKVYVTQILNKIDNLETKLFTLLTANQQQTAKEREDERKERNTSTTNWQELIRYVIGGTIIAIVFYIMGNGGN